VKDCPVLVSFFLSVFDILWGVLSCVFLKSRGCGIIYNLGVTSCGIPSCVLLDR